MDDRKMLFFSFMLICLTNLSPSLAADVVPVLVWGNKNVEVSPPPAGHSLSTDQFMNNILGQLDQHSQHDILLFLQNHLSLDDLTHSVNAYSQGSDGGTLHKLKSLMTSHPSFHLPRVVSPQGALDTWREKFDGKVHELKAPYNINDVPLSKEKRNMIVVHLPEDDSLKQSDDVMDSVSRDMDSLGRKYSALYTAGTSSKTHRESVYTGRHLLQTATDTPTHFYNVSSCIFFYADNITFEVKSQQNSSFVLTRADFTQSSCSPPNLVLKFPTVGSLTQLTLTVEFINETGYWYANNWKVSYDMGGTHKTDVVMKVGDNIYGPMKHSYHCTKPRIQQEVNGSDTNQAVLYVKNLQLQGFQMKNNKFGLVNDCIGFFTIPIWSGLISTLVLLLILAFGVQMLANINTMDRFDDPKGKTITVNVNE